VTPAAISSSFLTAIDPANFPGLRDQARAHGELPPAIDGDEFGEVELPLGVVRRDAAERLEERGQIEGVDAAVDLADRLLRRRGVALLNDTRDLAVFPDDSTVAMGPLDHRRQDGGRRLLLPVGLEETAKCRWAQERHVARQHQYRPGAAGEHRLRLL
jgi:hypothetical protein